MRVNAINIAVERRNGRRPYQRQCRTWRRVAAFLGVYSAAYWCLVAQGIIKPSRRAKNALRRRLGLAPRGVTRIVDMRTEDLAWYLRNRR